MTLSTKNPSASARSRPLYILLFLALISSGSSADSPAARVMPQSAAPPFTTAIVLPPRVVAGRPATLAALDADGKLLSGATVEIGARSQESEVQHISTGPTGRAVFAALANGDVLIARAPGASAAALIHRPGAPPAALAVPPIVSQHDRFSICGGEFHGDAEENRVLINGDPALVLAASPECLVALAGPNVKPGAANIIVRSGTAQWSVNSTIVSLEFDRPNPLLIPGQRSSLVVRVRGSEQPLAIVVENKTPGVLKFLHGDLQPLKTSGGALNTAAVQVETLRSGDFSFQARLTPPQDLQAAGRYLAASASLAGKQWKNKIAGLADRLARHPSDAAKIKIELGRILVTVPEGDLRTTLEAASASL